MHSEFQPRFRHPHIATIAGNFWPRKIDTTKFPAIRTDYRVNSETTLVAIEHQPEDIACRGQIVFLHGLEGSSEAGYIYSLSQEALQLGYGVHRLNMRTCGESEHLSQTMYHSGLTSDPLFVLNALRRRFQGPLFLVGFSLGGNVALKLAGELGNSPLLAGVCAASTPIDLAAAVRAIDRPANRLYARRFLSRLKRRIRNKSISSPALYSAEGLDAVKCIWDFDNRFTAPLFGFGNAANYYATQSAKNFLDSIRIPTLVLTAKDDPLVPFEMYKIPVFETNPALTLVAPRFGGHLGFLSRRRPRFWLDTTIMKWIENVHRRHSEETVQTAPAN